MIRQRLLSIGAPIVAIAALFLAGSDSFAQHYGGGSTWDGGGGGGWHDGGDWSGRGWGYDGFGRGYGIGSGWGYPYYGSWGNRGYPYDYGYPLYYGDYSNNYPYYGNYANFSSRTSGYEGVGQPISLQKAAHLRILVAPDAKVWFDGAETTQSGSERVFATPTLEPGRSYTYQVRAEGSNGAKTKQVSFYAGDTVTVDLR
jgi:uncharacterized protein (TIGR03000 family)